MAYRVICHPKAEAELDHLYVDIALEAGERTAGDYVDGVISFIEALETFPERGAVRESRIAGLRIIGYWRNSAWRFRYEGMTYRSYGVLGLARRSEWEAADTRIGHSKAKVAENEINAVEQALVNDWGRPCRRRSPALPPGCKPFWRWRNQALG